MIDGSSPWQCLFICVMYRNKSLYCEYTHYSHLSWYALLVDVFGTIHALHATLDSSQLLDIPLPRPTRIQYNALRMISVKRQNNWIRPYQVRYERSGVNKFVLELSKISQIEKVGLEVTANVITVFADSIILGIEYHHSWLSNNKNA